MHDRKPVVERALARLLKPKAVLARAVRGGGFGVYGDNDRRRRPCVRLSETEVRNLEADGSIEATAGGEAFALSAAGRKRLARLAAEPELAFAVQHRPLIARAFIDANGSTAPARGHELNGAVKRLAALRDGNGAPCFSDAELHAAARLREDWELGQAGLLRGSNWIAPPKSGGARGPSNTQEGAMNAQCDARRRVAEALDALALPLRRIVEAVCLREEGLVVFERLQGWPGRSGKIALKLGLAQLALRM